MTRPHAARIYDYALGGKDNFAADRELVDKISAIVPETPLVARDNRAFLGRAVRFLTEAGIRQFIDVGTGLPTRGNVHEVAQRIAPEARVAYVDYDPIVLTHSRALLSSVDSAITVQGDVREPDEIIDDPEVRRLLDLDRPVAVLLVGILHLVDDEDDPAAIVARFSDAMVPGSYLALCHITGDYRTPEAVARWVEVFGSMAEPMVPRSYEQVLRYLDGFDLVEPGLVKACDWRPELPSPIESPDSGWLLAAVGGKA